MKDVELIISFSLVADLPGIIEGSHKNKGLGITFLRHAERCMGLLILLDMSLPKPWDTLQILRSEVLCFSTHLSQRPQIVVANKMDCEGSDVSVNTSSQLRAHVEILKLNMYLILG